MSAPEPEPNTPAEPARPEPPTPETASAATTSSESEETTSGTPESEAAESPLTVSARTRRPLVTLHGLGRTKLAMVILGSRLRDLGYEVHNLGYFGPRGLEHSARQIQDTLRKRGIDPETPIDLVTHSMGGIVARALVTGGHISAHRIVQLAPPNEGAWIADRVRKIPLLGRIPAFRDLGQREDTKIQTLGTIPTSVEVGVIAGESTSAWLGGEPGDGVVRVEETYLEGAQDWILLPHFHTLIMNGRDTLQEIHHFLQEGQFTPSAQRLERPPTGGFQRRATPPTQAPEEAHLP